MGSGSGEQRNELPDFASEYLLSSSPASLDDLDVGCFRLKFEEVANSCFCGNQERKDLWNNATPYLEALLLTPKVRAVYILGSFVGAKESPNDVDVVFFHTCTNETDFLKQLEGNLLYRDAQDLQMSVFSHLKTQGLDLHGSPGDGGGGIDCCYCNINHSWRACLECLVSNGRGSVIHLVKS